MRVHTTAIQATKHFPPRIHVKFTDDNNVPDNVRDRTFEDTGVSSPDHLTAALEFLRFHKMHDRFGLKYIGPTLIKRGHVYQIEEMPEGWPPNHG